MRRNMEEQDVLEALRAWLASPTPVVDAARAERLALERFGLRSRATPLVAERDRNFRLEAADGTAYVLKVHTAQADAAALAFQNRALLHAAATDPGLPIPRPCPAPNGAHLVDWTRTDGTRHCVRLMTWQPGQPVDFSRVPDATRRDTGRLLARSQLALFAAPVDGAPQDLPWDLDHFGALAALLPSVSDVSWRGAIEHALKLWNDELEPAIREQPRQVVHNDFNPDNLLVRGADNPQVCGIIDFGDMVVAPRICDLAVACAYQLGEGGDVAERLLPVLQGYQDLVPLSDADLALLPGLAACRLASSLLIQAHRGALHPDNAEYFAGGSAHTAEALLRCLAQRGGGTSVRLREGLGLSQKP